MVVGGAPTAIMAPAAGAVGSRQGLTLVAGPDAEATCAAYPCATVSFPSPTQALVSFSVGIDSKESLQPATYYTDLIAITNPTESIISISSVQVSGLADTRPGDPGAITVFYCQLQTNNPQTGCGSSFIDRSSTGGYAFQGADQLAPGATRYLEFAGFAGTSAHTGDKMSFTVEVTAG